MIKIYVWNILKVKTQINNNLLFFNKVHKRNFCTYIFQILLTGLFRWNAVRLSRFFKNNLTWFFYRKCNILYELGTYIL